MLVEVGRPSIWRLRAWQESQAPDAPEGSSIAPIFWIKYPLVIQHSYGKSLCLIEKSTINGDLP